ncbi:MAG: phospholipid carrier-dependent glycosyltransferase [Planctomycetes bacterium]|nr:phospholipid carrier-dependent glycosyltransferase [Planctomycetota bacterium]
MQRDRTIALWLFGVAACFLCIFVNWTPQEGDAEIGFQQIRALARRGELYLSADTPSTELALKMLDPEGGAYNCRKGRGDRQYPYWGLGFAATGVPLYYLGSVFDSAFPEINKTFEKQTFGAEALAGSEYFARIFVFTLQPLAAAAAIALIYIACRRASVSQFAALMAALACGFGTHLCVQARSGLSDAEAVFATALALERALAARASRRDVDFVVFGAAAGFALIVKLHTAFAIAPLALLFISRERGFSGTARSFAFAAAGAAPFILIFGGANWVRWGSPFITGYEKSTAQKWFTINVFAGLRELIFSHSKGVIAYAFPLFMLTIAGFARSMTNPGRALPVILLISAAAALAMPASTLEWHGAWAFGPRYALIAYPAMAVIAAAALDRLSLKLRIASAAFVALGFALVFPGMLTSPYGGTAIAMDGARTRWPDARDPDRFQLICQLPITDPLNLMIVQHALARAAFAGRDGLRYREDLNIQKDGESMPPPQIEFTRFGAIGPVGHSARFGGVDRSVYAVWLAQFGLVAIVIFTFRKLGQARGRT